MSRKLLPVMLFGLVFVLVVAACSPAATPTAVPTREAAIAEPTKDTMLEPTADAMLEPTADAMLKPTADAMAKPTEDAMMSKSPAWLAMPLTDVNTGQSFKLSDFKGQVVLVEGIAAWCTNCLQQQRELAKLHEELDDDEVLSVAIDIDLQENAALLKKHAETNGFDWRYAVATPELAQALSAEFGSQFLNPPSVPMFLLDKEGGVHLLDFGQKSVDYLTQQIQMYP
ncbi:hypothetical protein TFLX_03737 [Thermoflexales bacterium]|nr:hypothetical protein TFLX_03737 [Thermoflexales bacterium]